MTGLPVIRVSDRLRLRVGNLNAAVSESVAKPWKSFYIVMLDIQISPESPAYLGASELLQKLLEHDRRIMICNTMILDSLRLACCQ